MPKRIHLWKHIHSCQFWAGPKHLTRKLKMVRYWFVFHISNERPLPRAHTIRGSQGDWHTQPAKNGIFEQRKIMEQQIGPVIVRNTKRLKDHGHNFETEDATWFKLGYKLLNPPICSQQLRYILHKSPSKSWAQKRMIQVIHCSGANIGKPKKPKKSLPWTPVVFCSNGFFQGLPWIFLTTWANKQWWF